MKRAAWFALLAIALAALLVPLLSDLVRDVLLVELFRIAWKIDRLVDSLPQEPFWLAFLVVAILAAAISLLPRPGRSEDDPDPPRRFDDQVADLALLIRRAGRRQYFRRRLVQRLSHLGRAVFAHRHSVDLSDLTRGSGPAGQGMLPAAGRHGPGGAAPDSLHPDAPLQHALARLRAEPATMRSAIDPVVEIFIQFLEEQLEVDNGPVRRSRR